MTKEIILEKSTLVQIMNEVDELTDAEKTFVLYWLQVKNNSHTAAIADKTVMPNSITMDDVYAERNKARNESVR